MNKYMDMLEKNVQWVALGIGGLWLLFMVYTYVIVADSSTVDVAGQKVGAASVDKVVREKADQLRERMERNEKFPEKAGDLARRVVEQLKIETPGPLGEIIVSAQGGGVVKPPTTRPGEIVAVPIKDLPKVAKATDIDAVALRSVVKLPLPQPPPQAGQQPAQPVEGEPQLLPYVVVAANFPMPALGQEFTRVITQPVVQLHQTVLLRVELLREELQPDGTWSKPVVIPTHDFTPQQVPTPPWPKDDRTQQVNFIQLALANQPSLAQPKFVAPIRGDVWRLPGQPAAQVGGPNVPQPPPPEENPMPQPQPKMGPVRPTPPVPTPRRPTGRGERGDATDAQPKGVVTIAQAFDNMPAAPNPGMGQPGMGVNPAVPGAGLPAVPPANLPGEVPKLAFDPANANVFPMWVHDITVLPGKTYRYRMRYTIKNPVFTANNVCNPPKLGDVFSIDSELSEPTKAITIPNTTFYFAVNAPMVGGRDVKHVEFAVFTWTVDGLKTHRVIATPGDMVDPSLKVTLVDVRDAGRTIILMDEHGILSTRNFTVDSKSPEYDEAKKIFEQQVIAPVAGR